MGGRASLVTRVSTLAKPRRPHVDMGENVEIHVPQNVALHALFGPRRLAQVRVLRLVVVRAREHAQQRLEGLEVAASDGGLDHLLDPVVARNERGVRAAASRPRVPRARRPPRPVACATAPPSRGTRRASANRRRDLRVGGGVRGGGAELAEEKGVVYIVRGEPLEQVGGERAIAVLLSRDEPELGAEDAACARLRTAR